MAQLEFVGFDLVGQTLEAPQGVDTYVAKRPVHLEFELTTDSTIDGRDLAADGAKTDKITITIPIDLDALNARVMTLDASVVLMGEWDPSSGDFPASDKSGESWIVSVDGTVDLIEFKAGDRIVALIDNASIATYADNWHHLDYTDKVVSVAGRTGAVVLTEADISDLQSYLLPANIDSIAKLNAFLTGEALIDTGDTRLSDARTPISHTHTYGDITGQSAFITDITAYAGGGQSNAFQLSAGMNVITICASAGDSAKLPEVVASEEVIVVNLGDEYLELFPFVGQEIDTLAANMPLTIMPNSSVTLRGLDTVSWKVTSPQSGGWKDLEMSVTGAATGGGSPTNTAFGPSGNIKQVAFGVNDSVYLAGHVPHDIKPGSTMYLHVHWSTDDVEVNSVKWQMNWIAAAGHNQANFPADTVVNVEEAAHGTAWRHMITEDSIGIPAPEVDSLFLVELKRITNGGSDNSDKVFGLYVDLHYEAVTDATPYRTPGFYKQ